MPTLFSPCCDRLPPVMGNLALAVDDSAPALAACLAELRAVEPPRLRFGRRVAGNEAHLWDQAAAWVARQKPLLARITAAVARHYPGTARDLEGQALLEAFEALRACALAGRMEDFVACFCGRYHHAVVALCRHVPLDRAADVETLADPCETVPFLPGARWPAKLTARARAAALAKMTPRQAKAWRHYLDGWDPALGKAANAARLGLSAATFYRDLEAGIAAVRAAAR